MPRRFRIPIRRKAIGFWTCSCWIWVGLGFAAGCRPETPQAPDAGQGSPGAEYRVFESIPAAPDPSHRFIIYLHGAIVERLGPQAVHPRFGPYQYREILQTLTEQGFDVVSSIRSAEIPPETEAERIFAQIRTLMERGVPARRITVVGFSKGGSIAVLASARSREPDVNWVIQAGCGPWITRMPRLVPSGRVLSMIDRSDDVAGSCTELMERMPPGSDHREITLDLGAGHGTFYSPRAEWIEPIRAWSNP